MRRSLSEYACADARMRRSRERVVHGTCTTGAEDAVLRLPNTEGEERSLINNINRPDMTNIRAVRGAVCTYIKMKYVQRFIVETMQRVNCSPI